MFQRVICLTTIAAIIACPLWCNSGLCGAAHCDTHRCVVDGLGEQSSDLPDCCRKTSPAPTSSAPEDQTPAPCGCPSSAYCQGVCGGAVFQEPVELNVSTLSFFIWQNETGTLLEPQLSELQLRDARYHWHCHGGNYGRSLRTLQMSFLL